MNERSSTTVYIGDVAIPNRVALAPMAGVCDRTYRVLAKSMGVGLITTEMVSAKGIMYDNERTMRMLVLDEGEHPVAVQLFGNEPTTMAAAAQVVERCGADIIDINMGCPVHKVVRNGEGSALLKDVPLAAAVVRAMVAAVSIPITVKMRIGWDSEHINGVAAAMVLADAGAAAITVHGRTRQQMYSGHADWDMIRQIVEAVDIPVWGNGDVIDGESAQRMLDETGCMGVAIGRAAQGNPFVFREVVQYLATGRTVELPSDQERMDMCKRHLHALAEEKGEHIAVREMRTHAMGYFRGMRGSTVWRKRLNALLSIADWDAVLDEAKRTING